MARLAIFAAALLVATASTLVAGAADNAAVATTTTTTTTSTTTKTLTGKACSKADAACTRCVLSKQRGRSSSLTCTACVSGAELNDSNRCVCPAGYGATGTANTVGASGGSSVNTSHSKKKKAVGCALCAINAFSATAAPVRSARCSPCEEGTSTQGETGQSSCAPEQGQLDVAYYNLGGPTSSLPNFASLAPYLETTVPDLNFPSTAGNFANSGLAEYVGAVFTGWVNIPAAGTWSFFTVSDDGSKLYIDNQLVVDNDGVHGMRERGGTVDIATPGNHLFQVEFFENGGGAGLIVSWQGPAVEKQVVPSFRFSTPPPP